METKIHSNGAAWFGEAPGSLQTLFDVLQAHPLDRVFERFGGFIMPREGRVEFFGNFHTLSHVFRIETSDPALIERLTAAIQANTAREDYRAQPYPADYGQVVDDRKIRIRPATREDWLAGRGGQTFTDRHTGRAVTLDGPDHDPVPAGVLP